MKKTQKGFTLIELLIVIAIIGILAGVILVSTSSARNKAAVAKTKETLASMKAGIALCCGTSTTNTLKNTAGGALCSDATVSSLLPQPADLGGSGATYTVTSDCNAADPMYTVAVAGHPEAACVGNWTVTMNKVTSPAAGC